MRPNPWQSALRSGGIALGGWLSNPSTINAEILGKAGFEYVVIDTQHGAIDYTAMLPMLQALGIGASTAIVRVADCEAGLIGKALDAGARAVIVPMVNDRETCERALSFGHYPPRGVRSYGPTRTVLIEGDDYFDHVDGEVTVIPMIETTTALEKIDEILSTPNLDAIYVGPNDLAVSLGIAPNTADDRLEAALDSIAQACQRHGVVAGVHGSAAACARRVGQGFRMVTVCADVVALRRQVAADVKEAREACAGFDPQ